MTLSTSGTSRPRAIVLIAHDRRQTEPRLTSRSLLPLAVSMALMGGATALAPIGWAADSTEVNRLIAAVNNRPITQSEVRNAAAMQVQVLVMQSGRSMSTQALEQKVKEIEQNALQDLIDRELILDSFKTMGATIRPQHVDDAVERFIKERFQGDEKKFVGELKNSGMSLQQFRQMQEETIIVGAMRARNADSVPVFATPDELQEFWKSNAPLFSTPGAVKLRTITIPKLVNGDVSTALSQKALVEEIHSKLEGGADFGAMARAYSVDSGAQDDGVRGTFKKEDLQASLSEAAFAVPVQSVSDVIDLGDFYTIIYVDARDDGEVAPLTDPKVEEEVRRRVLQNKRQESVERWLTRLRRDANIRIYE
jgi:peptidyl-prolyl cis-trans isomerase SurA